MLLIIIITNYRNNLRMNLNLFFIKKKIDLKVTQ